MKKTPFIHLLKTNQVYSGLHVSQFTNADYLATHEAMLKHTLERIAVKKGQKLTDVLTDELWVVEHNDVYTLGQGGKEEHILHKNTTPVIKTDRGGQVTWHGKGQLVIYWLFDLNKVNWKVRDLVSHAEQAIEDIVNQYLPTNLIAKARKDAPGVYIYQRNLSAEDYNMLGKIASLGFKIKQGYSYHGIALNLDCDLAPFNFINPCGYAGMQMLRLADFIDIKNTNDKVNQNTRITQDLVSNIIQRHMGKIPLRK